MYTITFDGVAAGPQQGQLHFECHAAWQAEVAGVEPDAHPFTANALLMQHKAIAQALKADDETPPGNPKPHGVRDTPDWRTWRDQLERQLTAQGISFVPIVW
jgi:hypothetical protein